MARRLVFPKLELARSKHQTCRTRSAAQTRRRGTRVMPQTRAKLQQSTGKTPVARGRRSAALEFPEGKLVQDFKVLKFARSLEVLSFPKFENEQIADLRKILAATDRSLTSRQWAPQAESVLRGVLARCQAPRSRAKAGFSASSPS
jgi:hypothetical protein